MKQGTDGALAMAMGHVILQEFYVDNQVEYFTKYAKQYTDFPFFVTLKQKGDQFVADRFLNASDIGRETKLGTRMILQHLMAQWGHVGITKRNGIYV